MAAGTSECKINSELKRFAKTTKRFHFVLIRLEVFWSRTNFFEFCIIKQHDLFHEYL